MPVTEQDSTGLEADKVRRLSHRGDPDTSREAAEKLSPEAVSQQKAAILSILSEGPRAPFEVADLYMRVRVREGWPRVKADSINKRMSEMKSEGLIRVAVDGEDHPLRATSPFGRRAEKLEVAS